jgi:hypothetical protein
MRFPGQVGPADLPVPNERAQDQGPVVAAGVGRQGLPDLGRPSPPPGRDPAARLGRVSAITSIADDSAVAEHLGAAAVGTFPDVRDVLDVPVPIAGSPTHGLFVY